MHKTNLNSHVSASSWLASNPPETSTKNLSQPP